MIDVNQLRENPEKFKKATADKQLDPGLVDEALKIDGEWRKVLGEVEVLRSQRNEAARSRDTERGKAVKQKLQKLEERLKVLEEKQKLALQQIPNPACRDVKAGRDDTENEVVRDWGRKPEFTFPVRDYLELGEELGLIDVERASKVSGTRFAYLKGDLVLLEFALVQFAFSVLVQEGFMPIIPPVLIKRESMSAMGYLEHGGGEEMYFLPKDNLVLVGTSEQSIGPMYKDEVLRVGDLPLRYVGFSNCFRREAGSYGKDTRGILRVHQFDKVEMFSFAKAEDSDKEHEFLLSMEEKLFQSLGIHYRVIKMCSGDLGLPAARKYDLEAWMPGQGKYREVTSTSTCTDFQARRLNIRYQDKGGLKYIHTLNGTAFAIGRTVIAIIENYQQKDGSIIVPKVLRKWMGKEKIGLMEIQ